MDKLSYAVGVLIAQNLKQQGLDAVESADLAAGVKDVVEGKDLQMSVQEANSVLEMHMKAKATEMHGDNIAIGQKFLEENGKRSEVTTTASGLQYEVITAGDGATPSATDKVTTHYQGTLIDGTVFDSSIKRGQPASFPVNGVIMGWQEALQLMKVGDKWKLYIPYNLAYGEQGAGGAIKPFSTLIFDIELLSID